MQMEQNRSLVVTDPGALAAAESVKARIQAKYLVAINKPRNRDEARQKILNECRRPMFAERVEFSKPVANTRVKGLSIRFAEVALSLWENIDADTSIVYEDDNYRRVKVMVMDLETNASFSKEVQVKKTVERKKPTADRDIISERTNSKGEIVYIVTATDDELQNKENAAVSKVIRNEGLRLLPADIKDEAVAIARETLRNRDAQDPDAAKKKLFDAFNKIGITVKDIEGYLGRKPDHLTPAELSDLREIHTAISDGEGQWADYFGKSKEEDEGSGKGEEQKPKAETTTTQQAATTETKPETTTGEAEKPPTVEDEFYKRVAGEKIDKAVMAKFVSETAKEMKRTEIIVMRSALNKWDGFKKRFGDWATKQPAATKENAPGADPNAVLFQKYTAVSLQTLSGLRGKGVSDLIERISMKLPEWNQTEEGKIVIGILRGKVSNLKEAHKLLPIIDEALNPKPAPADKGPEGTENDGGDESLEIICPPAEEEGGWEGMVPGEKVDVEAFCVKGCGKFMECSYAQERAVRAGLWSPEGGEDEQANLFDS